MYYTYVVLLLKNTRIQKLPIIVICVLVCYFFVAVPFNLCTAAMYIVQLLMNHQVSLLLTLII